MDPFVRFDRMYGSCSGNAAHRGTLAACDSALDQCVVADGNTFDTRDCQCFAAHRACVQGASAACYTSTAWQTCIREVGLRGCPQQSAGLCGKEPVDGSGDWVLVATVIAGFAVCAVLLAVVLLCALRRDRSVKVRQRATERQELIQRKARGVSVENHSVVAYCAAQDSWWEDAEREWEAAGRQRAAALSDALLAAHNAAARGIADSWMQRCLDARVELKVREREAPPGVPQDGPVELFAVLDCPFADWGSAAQGRFCRAVASLHQGLSPEEVRVTRVDPGSTRISFTVPGRCADSVSSGLAAAAADPAHSLHRMLPGSVAAAGRRPAAAGPSPLSPASLSPQSSPTAAGPAPPPWPRRRFALSCSRMLGDEDRRRFPSAVAACFAPGAAAQLLCPPRQGGAPDRGELQQLSRAMGRPAVGKTVRHIPTGAEGQAESATVRLRGLGGGLSEPMPSTVLRPARPVPGEGPGAMAVGDAVGLQWVEGAEAGHIEAAVLSVTGGGSWEAAECFVPGKALHCEPGWVEVEEVLQSPGLTRVVFTIPVEDSHVADAATVMERSAADPASALNADVHTERWTVESSPIEGAPRPTATAGTAEALQPGTWVRRSDRHPEEKVDLRGLGVLEAGALARISERDTDSEGEVRYGLEGAPEAELSAAMLARYFDPVTPEAAPAPAAPPHPLHRGLRAASPGQMEPPSGAGSARSPTTRRTSTDAGPRAGRSAEYDEESDDEDGGGFPGPAGGAGPPAAPPDAVQSWGRGAAAHGGRTTPEPWDTEPGAGRHSGGGHSASGGERGAMGRPRDSGWGGGAEDAAGPASAHWAGGAGGASPTSASSSAYSDSESSLARTPDSLDRPARIVAYECRHPEWEMPPRLRAVVERSAADPFAENLPSRPPGHEPPPPTLATKTEGTGRSPEGSPDGRWASSASHSPAGWHPQQRQWGPDVRY